MILRDLSGANFVAVVADTVEAIRRGDLVLFPTDTVYGIGGLAFSQTVFEKLQRVKPERGAKPTAVLIDSIIRMSQCAGDVPSPRIVALAERFWPGPLTLVWKTSGAIPEEFQTPDRSLGYRVPKSDFLLQVLSAIEAPLWATSANLPGHKPPGFFGEVSPAVTGACDFVVKTGELLQGRASTVVDVRGKEPVVVRELSVKESEIMSVWKHA
ncbi:threonylcarbamoyl-AMP synthase [candidate division KSB1 bacterium]|nr:threonylcarbamoyl-AMP synthase [candidate division KSB1 bacterium]